MFIFSGSKSEKQTMFSEKSIHDKELLSILQCKEGLMQSALF